LVISTTVDRAARLQERVARLQERVARLQERVAQLQERVAQLPHQTVQIFNRAREIFQRNYCVALGNSYPTLLTINGALISLCSFFVGRCPTL
jgi:ABC-type Fe3+-hydroxamate transport system substrate-binding protein